MTAAPGGIRWPAASSSIYAAAGAWFCVGVTPLAGLAAAAAGEESSAVALAAPFRQNEWERYCKYFLVYREPRN